MAALFDNLKKLIAAFVCFDFTYYWARAVRKVLKSVKIILILY